MHTLKNLVQVLTCVVALAGLSACGDKAKDGDKAPTDAKKGAAAKSEAPKQAAKGDKPAPKTDAIKKAAESNKAADAKAGDSPADPQVTLLAAGDNPQQLRLKLQKGQSVTAEMVMKMAMKMEINGMKPPEVALPPTRMLMDMKVVDAQPDLYSYTFEVTEAAPMETKGVQPMVMEAMKKALNNAKGLKGKGSVDSRGMNKGASFELPPNMDPQTRQLMDGMRDAVGRMSAPLPKEPVGVGGKWKVVQQLKQNGMTLDQTATYTVKAIDGDKVTLDVAVEMDAKPQEVKAPGMPPNSKMLLEKMTGKGGGETVQSMASLLPEMSKVNIKTAMKSTVEAMGQKQKMGMDMTMDVTIQPKK